MTAGKIHLEFLLEGETDEVVLKALLPKMLPPEVTYTLHGFQGKDKLMKKLPERLRGYRALLPSDWKIVILRDNDSKDCKKLRKDLDDIVIRENFALFSNTDPDKKGNVVIRLAMQEMEAWFFGDVEALRQAYPRLPATLHNKKGYRQPDAIASPWLKLKKLLKAAGYHPGGKREVAREISPHLEPSRNRSRSFQLFWQTLMQVCQEKSPGRRS